MTLRFAHIFACLPAGLLAFSMVARSEAQTPRQDLIADVAPGQVSTLVGVNAEVPDAPQPQQTPAASQSPSAPQSQTTPAVPPGAAATPAVQPPKPGETPQSQRDVAEEQLKQEKKQRIGILPNFNASYITDAAPLTPGQKFRLMFSTEKDPATIGFSMFVALIGQAEGSHPAYGGGIGGYGKRFGQNYADTFDGAFWGNAVLPSILHQDPRYFRLGTGTPMHRILYALSTNVRAKHDGTGKWEPNYSNLIGNVISGGISNIYLPADERGVGSTFEGAFVVTAEGGVGSMLEEFWPDFIQYLGRAKRRKYLRTHPADVDVVAPKPAAAPATAPAPPEKKPDQE